MYIYIYIGHSLSDLLSDFITLWAVQIARLPADDDHPYGHGKFESIGSLFLSLTLVATGLSVGAWSYEVCYTLLVYFYTIPIYIKFYCMCTAYASSYNHATTSLRRFYSCWCRCGGFGQGRYTNPLLACITPSRHLHHFQGVAI